MTTAVLLQIVTGLLGILSLWLRDYYSKDKTEKRNEDKKDDLIQKGRQAIVDGNADAVSKRIDKLLSNQLQDSGITGVTNSKNQDG